MNAMPQLNEAEHKFFESGGREMAPALSEGLTEKPESEPQAEAGDQDWIPASAGMTDERVEDAASKSAPEKEARQEKLVPLQALQQERAEKKQLRDELKAYREWQAQLTQRLQQMPAAQAPQAPDPQTKPLEYINHVLGTMQASTAELQQWRQQQEQTAQRQAAVQQYASWAAAQEQEFAKAQPEYHEAYRYAADTRERELQALGYTDPAQRAAIVRQNTAEIIDNAIQQGRNPAELVWDYAQARGFTPKGKRAGGTEEAQAKIAGGFVASHERPAMDGGAGRHTRGGSVSGAAGVDEAHMKIAAGLQAAGAKLNQGGATGEGDLSAKDLAGITDPDEFEKAWKKVFGKRR